MIENISTSNQAGPSVMHPNLLLCDDAGVNWLVVTELILPLRKERYWIYTSTFNHMAI